MLRRVVKQAGLYHINNVVEVNNLISISSGYAIGSYDLDQLQGQVVLACPRQGPGTRALARGVSPSPTCPCSPTTWALRQPQQRQPPGDDPARPPPGGLRPVRL